MKNHTQYEHTPHLLAFVTLLKVLACAFWISAWSTQNTEDTLQPETPDSTLLSVNDYDVSYKNDQPTYSWYYNNESVDSGYFDVDFDRVYLLIAGSYDSDSNYHIEIRGYDSLSGIFDWGSAYDIDIESQYDMAVHLRDYADSTNATAYVDSTNEIPAWYTEYEEDYLGIGKTQAIGYLGRDFFGGPTALVVHTNPALIGGWNNSVSRVFHFHILAVYFFL
ncbi:MAG: hypothetical protein OHK0039_47440 [Bacteroidia bacterium]